MVSFYLPINVLGAMAEGSMIQVVAFALVFGAALGLVNQEPGGSRVLQFVCDINSVIAKMLSVVILVAPIGVFALLGWVTGVIGVAVILPLAKFLLALLLGAVLTYLGMMLWSAPCA